MLTLLAPTDVVRISQYHKILLQFVLQNASKEFQANNISHQRGLNKRFSTIKKIGLVCATLAVPQSFFKGRTL